MDQNERLHRDWIGMAQPEGLVVTPAALKAAEANITSPVVELQAQLRELAADGKTVRDLRALLRDVLEWSDEFVVTEPESLRVGLDGGEVLAPTLALRSADDPSAFVLLVLQVATGLDTATDDKRWTATAHQRFERLLRDTGVHVGLLTNGSVFRLVYAPKGESAGWVSFRVDDMLQVAGRDLLGAFHMLLNERRLLSLEEGKRLMGLLKASREYQNTVSNRLREQILSALRELLGGLQQADRMAGGSILRDYGEHRQEIYSGLVTVLMRMVFVLFAEERGLLPIENELYAGAYSLSRLHAQLGEDRARHGDTLNDRFGAWARIVSLFRLLHDGAVAANGLRIPARRGDFFNPDKHPFLEGRPRGAVRQLEEVLEVPRISDGVIFRVLDQLLVLEGERLQYKGLDVEQIGSVYEGLMGFEIEEAKGPSIALGSDSAPVVVNLERLLALAGAERIKFLKSDAGVDVKDKAAGEVRAAKSIEELQAALSRRMSKHGGLIAAESLYLQPGEERRKSGSHYTPRSLTAPIVETTLRPVLERLGPEVTPAQLLDLKICDPAMGSAAFLVEACRQLADHLVAAWRRTGTMPELPPDEDPVLHARRLIAQRCLYGVDKNPLAVDLARLSLWLVTFAKEHPFTFVDHALRCGDSLVGLSREQIASLSLDVGKGAQVETVRAVVEPAVRRAVELRRQIHEIGDPPDTARLVELWRETNEALDAVRVLGDLVVAAFLSADSDKARKRAYDDLGTKARLWLVTGQHATELRGMRGALSEGKKGIDPFHWEIEFPEVLERANPGFDCFVGNPPFMGGSRVSTLLGMNYFAWLTQRYPPASHHCDLVAYFFRRLFGLLRGGGSFGLLATNTISQGDSREGGLTPILRDGGTIYAATRRLRWPGAAAVVVSVVHVLRGSPEVDVVLDGRMVARISAFLVEGRVDSAPQRLCRNPYFSIGSQIYGQGFLFADGDEKSTPVSRMHEILLREPDSRNRVLPYIGGE
ncbi:MAG: N-6 DNA methylase, partial [Myxococcales bacterium]|nr:N-6 DNA methylase [Myxococcales bacterium]